MSEADELKALREEVANLRQEVERLRADRTVHHYHHQAAPAPTYYPPVYDPNRAAPVLTPPWVVTCAADPTPGPTVVGIAPAIGGYAPRIT